MNNNLNNNLNNNQGNSENQLNGNNTFNNQNNSSNQQIIQFGNSINPNTENTNNQNTMNNEANIQNKLINNYQPNNNFINNQSTLNNSFQSQPFNNTQNSSNLVMENKTVNVHNNENNVVNDNKGKDDKYINNTLNAATTGISNDSKSEAKEDELEKIANNLNLDFLVLVIFSIIAFVYSILQSSFEITYIIELAILIVGYIGSKNKKPYAAVCGIITGFFMILFGNIIDLLLGIFIIIRSFKYNKILKKKGVKTKTLLYSILGIIGAVVITVVVTYFDLYSGHALKCTRSNGETIEVTFDPDGVSNLKINGKPVENVDLAIYKLHFANSFFLKGYSADSTSEKIKIYRNVVKEYEESENDAVCK